MAESWLQQTHLGHMKLQKQTYWLISIEEKCINRSLKTEKNSLENWKKKCDLICKIRSVVNITEESFKFPTIDYKLQLYLKREFWNCVKT